jgi:NTP pyrophosphatase (non-canonical NTP hydrolase)
MNESQASMEKWANETFGPVRRTGWERIFQRFMAEVVELRDALRMRCRSRTHCREAIAGELADCVILLYRLASVQSIDLDAEVDHKMAINRMRKWTTAGDRVGQHKAV